MITLTDSAKNQLDEYFADKDKQTIRIFLAAGGCCSGPKLALALDEATDLDEVKEVDGYTIAMEKKLYEEAQPLTVDMTYTGFDISSSLVLEQGGSCGSGCSGGTCSM